MDLLTPREAAAAAKVSVRTLYGWRYLGRLPEAAILRLAGTRTIRIRREIFERWLVTGTAGDIVPSTPPTPTPGRKRRRGALAVP